MTDDRRRTVLLLGAIAGAAGLALGALFLTHRNHDANGAEVHNSVAGVLSDCYERMGEIQSHIAELDPSLLNPIPESV